MKQGLYQIETLTVGQLGTNCYIIADMRSKDAVIIDPGDDGNYIAEKAVSLGVRTRAILITHGHFDHILGAYELQEILHIPVYMDMLDMFLVERAKESAQYYLKREVIEPQPVITAISSNQLACGSLVVDIIKTPGHTPGGVSFVIPDAQMVCTGDTIFAHGHIGRTDLSYSRPLDLSKSIHTLFKLPGEYVVYPGHGDNSTIQEEKVLYDNKNTDKQN
jgi:hydroxyacylglutathione hydrolase